VSTLSSDLTAPRRPQPTWRALSLATTITLALLALTIASPDTGGWLALDLALALVAFLWPTLAIYLLPSAVAFGSLAAVTVVGVRIGPTDALVGALTLAWLSAWLPSWLRRWRAGTARPDLLAALREKWRTAPEQILLFSGLILYLLAVIASGYHALDRIATAKEVIKWAEVLLLVSASLWFLRATRQLLILAWATIAAAVVEAVLGCIQFASADSAATVDRITGTFSQPNPYGAFLNLALPLALCLLFFAKDRRTRWLAGGAAAIIGLAEYFARSRGALLGLVVAAVVVALIRLRLERIAALLGGAAALVFGVAWYARLVPQSIQARLGGLVALDTASLCHPTGAANYSTMERLAQWSAGVNMFLSHPILGVGAGNYTDAYTQYGVVCWPNSLGHAHNYYINAAAETGAIGLIAFLALTFAMLFVGWRATHSPQSGSQDKFNTALALGFFACLITVVVHNVTDDLFVHAMELQVALSLAALMRLRVLAARAP
jgi:O-antigen ligase